MKKLKLDNILGHENIKSFFENSITNGNVANFYIFTGPSGIGKFLFAKTLAEILDVDDRDLIIIDNENSSNKSTSISIEIVNDIRKNIFIKPHKKRKMIIVNEASKLTLVAQNAFLKTLEEPPEFVVIIFVSENLNKIIRTIVSRAINLNFKTLQKNIILNYLNNSTNPGKCLSNQTISEICKGSIGKALELKNESWELREEVFNLLSEMSLKKYSSHLKFSNFMITHSTKKKVILEIFESFCNDCIIKKFSDANVKNKDKIKIIEKFCELRSEKILKIANIFVDYKKFFENEILFNVAFENMLNEIAIVNSI